MAYVLKEGQGSLFKNDKRVKDTHPHATGRAMIGGKVYWISAWTKDGNRGKFQSLAFKEADAKPQEKGKEFNDEIPNFNQPAASDDCPF